MINIYIIYIYLSLSLSPHVENHPKPKLYDLITKMIYLSFHYARSNWDLATVIFLVFSTLHHDVSETDPKFLPWQSNMASREVFYK